MTGHKKSTETRKCTMIGQTYFMWRNGYTNAEIAEKLKRPIEQVNELVEICNNADASKKAEADKIVLEINSKKKGAS